MCSSPLSGSHVLYLEVPRANPRTEMSADRAAYQLQSVGERIVRVIPCTYSLDLNRLLRSLIVPGIDHLGFALRGHFGS